MAKSRKRRAKMKAGSCKCIRRGVRLCKSKGGRVRIKGACRKRRSRR